MLQVRAKAHKTGVDMKKLVLLSAMLLTMGTAFAADLPSRMPPPAYVPPPPPLWTGPFLGASLGVGFGNSGNSVSGNKDLFCAGGVLYCNTPLSEQNFFAPGDKSDGASFAGGAQFGYNLQFDPSFVVGGVVDFLALNRSGGTTYTSSGVPVGPNTTETRTYDDSFNHDWLATVRLRIGPTFDNLWIYGTGGLALGDLRSRSSSATIWTNPNATPPSQVQDLGYGSTSGTALGYAVGAGAEYKITPNWSIFAEYLYYNLSKSYTVAVGPAGTCTTLCSGNLGTNSYGVKTKVDGNLVKVGLNYGFWTY
jgi:outer membrane immunogenic protein